MRAFTRPVSRTFEIKRDDEVLSFTFQPLALGYVQFLGRVFPQPVMYANAQPVPDQARLGEWQYETNLMVIAAALGGEMTAKAPTSSDPAAWVAYVRELRAEFAASLLTDGELFALLAEAGKASRGLGNLPKG